MALAAALIALCLASLASAGAAHAFGGLDRGFGEEGAVALGFEPAPQHPSYAVDVGTSPDGTIYVLNTANSSCTPSACSWDYFLIRLRPNGARDLTYGGDGTVELPGLDRDATLAVDGKGRQLVAIYDSAYLAVVRLRPNGTLDPSFGQEGTARIACGCTGAKVELGRNPSGYMFLIQQASPYTTGDGSDSEITVRRLTAKGRIDPSFGGGGTASIRISDTRQAGSATRLDGGGLAFLAQADWEKSGFTIARMGRQGLFDRRFATKTGRVSSAWMTREKFRYGRAHALVARGGGRFDVLGEVESQGFVLRLRRDGSIDRGFGLDGVKYLGWVPEAAIPGPGGRVFTIGQRNLHTTVGWLDRRGNPIKSFAGGYSMALPAVRVPEAALALQRGARPLVLEPGHLECRSGYCPPNPFLLRFTRWAPG